MQHNTFSFSF